MIMRIGETGRENIIVAAYLISLGIAGDQLGQSSGINNVFFVDTNCEIFQRAAITQGITRMNNGRH